MADIYVSIHPMEHQYILTYDINEIIEGQGQHLHVKAPACESYLGQEGPGLCIQFYDQDYCYSSAFCTP